MFMNNKTNPDDARELIHQELNKKKKQDLKERHDINMLRDSDLPAHIQGEVLDNVAEFERQWENAQMIPLRQYLGNPKPPPVAALSPKEITHALDQILELMAKHQVQIDFLTDVAEAEKYRFVVEELLDEKMNNIRIRGMSMNFIYEEFYSELVDWDKFGDELEDEE